jgi:hypothetical protein
MLILKRASASRPSGEWKDEDYDVLADGKAVGRIYEDTECGPVRAVRWGEWNLVEHHGVSPLFPPTEDGD